MDYQSLIKLQKLLMAIFPQVRRNYLKNKVQNTLSQLTKKKITQEGAKIFRKIQSLVRSGILASSLWHLWRSGFQSSHTCVGIWVPEFPHLCGDLVSRVPTPVWGSEFQSSRMFAGIWVPEFPHQYGDLGSRVPTPVRGSEFQGSHIRVGI